MSYKQLMLIEAAARLRDVRNNYYLDDCPPAKNDIYRYVEDLKIVAQAWLDSEALRSHAPPVPQWCERPTVVCLCGSTRFIDAFRKAEFDETLAGRIVLTIGCDTKSDGELFKGPEGDAIKLRLDELHKRKIDLADEVLILNVGGYIGSSTKSELEYAVKHGKTVRWLEAPSQGDAT